MIDGTSNNIDVDVSFLSQVYLVLNYIQKCTFQNNDMDIGFVASTLKHL